MGPKPIQNQPVQTNFSKIKIGSYFEASDGEKYKKTSELTYDDAYGLEHYIDPMFDKKINQPVTNAPGVDTSAKVVKDETVVDPSVKKSAKKTTKTKKGK